MIRKIIITILIIGIVCGQTLSSNTDKSKEKSVNEKKVTWLEKKLSFKKNPMILIKDDDYISIKSGDIIKILTLDGKDLMGIYYKISELEKQIEIISKKNTKVYYSDIIEISRGIDDYSFEYGFSYGIRGFFAGFSIGYLLVRSEGRYNPNFYKEMKKIMGLFFGATGGLSGFLKGYIVGLKTPRNFEESELISENEWSMHFKKEAIMLADKNLLERKKTNNSKDKDIWWSLNGQKPIKIKIEYDEVPIPKSIIMPHYPKLARQAAIEGTILIDTLIDDDGIVKAMIVNKGKPRSGLNKEAMKAIRKTKFKPAQNNKKSISVWITIPVDFNLN